MINSNLYENNAHLTLEDLKKKTVHIIYENHKAGFQAPSQFNCNNRNNTQNLKNNESTIVIRFTNT